MSEHREEMEKLIKETRLLWCEDCADGPSRLEYYSGYDDACEGGVETENLCRERARKVITRILSAVHDGRLDKELGVAVRQPVWSKERIVGIQRGDIIIALRPLSGTSQEDPVGGKEEKQ